MTDDPDYRGFRITELHAIVGVGPDDEEGICAYVNEMGSLPMISADPRRLEQMTAIAQNIANETGLKFEIVRFSVREKIGEIRSKKLQ